MHAIATLRSLLAAPRRGVVTALMVAVVIAGIVSMHSMSSSPSAHATATGMVVAQEATPAEPVATPTHTDAAECHTGCGSDGAHDMATAMCLMVLVALLTLAAPPASFLNAVLLPLARRVLVATPRSRPAAAPSLHALGISRT